jgi:hypothetical protein
VVINEHTGHALRICEVVAEDARSVRILSAEELLVRIEYCEFGAEFVCNDACQRDAAYSDTDHRVDLCYVLDTIKDQVRNRIRDAPQPVRTLADAAPVHRHILRCAEFCLLAGMCQEVRDSLLGDVEFVGDLSDLHAILLHFNCSFC